MKKTLSLFLAIVMLLTSISLTAFAAPEPATYYKDLYLQGLADSKVTKTTENYDGYHFVKGTKATWDCKLYTLTATVTSLSNNIATFDVRFDSKIPASYCTLDGWYGYYIHLASNLDSADYFPSDNGNMKLRVNVAKNDVFSESAAAGGTQFIKFKVEKTAKEDFFPIYSSNKYYSEIVKNRDVYPENAGYFSEAKIYDEYVLGYYVKPTFKLATNSFSASKNAFYLGIYAFNGIVKYRVAGTSAWKQKAIVKNQKLYLTGLKANTSYVIQVLCKLPYKDIETGQSKYDLDIVGSQFTLTTALTSKPLLKQVKVYGVKYGKYTRKGYWETRSTGGYVWHPAETFYTASYKVRVSLRNVPARAKGLYLKAGGYSAYQAGRKGTYTFSMTYQAKKPVKGKKLACNLYYSSNTINKSAVGFSPARGITYKIQNSTVNYKK